MDQSLHSYYRLMQIVVSSYYIELLSQIELVKTKTNKAFRVESEFVLLLGNLILELPVFGKISALTFRNFTVL